MFLDDCWPFLHSVNRMANWNKGERCEMKRIIMLGMVLATMLVSFGGCYWGYADRDWGERQDRNRGESHDQGRGGGHDRDEGHDHDRD